MAQIGIVKSIDINQHKNVQNINVIHNNIHTDSMSDSVSDTALCGLFFVTALPGGEDHEDVESP